VNEENTKKIIQQQMQFEFDKKEEAQKTEQEKKDIRQGIIRYSLIGGLSVLIIFLLVVFRQRNRISKEKKRSEELLLNILPAEVAAELKATGKCRAKTFSMVTVMFMDFKDFTKVSESVSAELLVDEINTCFSTFDGIIQKYRVEKIKTIGDAYICAGGLPVLNQTHAKDVINAAFEIRDFMIARKKEKDAKEEFAFEMRIGIHTGPVVAGIVGLKKFQYDIWGDTVNLAARMEQNSDAGKINISGSTYKLVKDKFSCLYRGKIEAKNKGEIEMYFIENLIS
jgi:class 3 adenylate cyclase